MPQPIAVLTAMEQEGRLVEAGLTNLEEHRAAGRRYVRGVLEDVPVVTAISGFGKVAAAATVATVLERFNPSLVLFAGVAGGVGRDVAIGDVVVAESLVQHDFDASPIFERFVIPSLGNARIPTDPELTEHLFAAARGYLAGTVHRGLIASGDRFIDSVAETEALQRHLPDVLAVEMEGAAVGQVCTEADVPFAVFRSISDRADSQADVDFLAFIKSIAAPLTAAIVSGFVARLT